MRFHGLSGLHCPLTRYLEDVSSRDERSARPIHAAVLLACVRYGDPKVGCDTELMGQTLKTLHEEHFSDVVSDLDGRCHACPQAGDCPVGHVVLQANGHGPGH